VWRADHPDLTRALNVVHELSAHPRRSREACWNRSISLPIDCVVARRDTESFPPSWVIILTAFIVLLGLWAFVLGLVGGYLVDEYRTPSFSEQSVPPSRTY
jgi:hypothetical protein